MKREELKSILQKITVAYPDKFKINQEIFDLWYECLSDLEPVKTDMAVLNHIKQSRFVPTIADIRNGYDNMVNERDETIRRCFHSMISHFNDIEGAFDVFADIISRQEEKKKVPAAEWICGYVVEHQNEDTLINLIKAATT